MVDRSRRELGRRLLREVASGSTSRGDTTTLEDQAVLEKLAQAYTQED